MNINDLIKLATLLDANGEHGSADELDRLIAQAAEDGIVISPETLQNMQETVNTMNNNLEETIEFLKTQGYEVTAPEVAKESAASLDEVFEKLAKVADELDAAGAMEEAGLIDAFLQKHAADPEDRWHKGLSREQLIGPEHKGPQFGAIAPYGEYGLDEEAEEEKVAREDFERDLEQQSGMGNISPEMEELRKEWELLQEKMKKAGLEVALVKEAEGIYDVIQWKEEDNKSEQSKRYDTKHHHNLQVREPKRDQERVDLEGRKEHHISTYKSSADRILNQRHCPEHIGVQMGRVAESTYQCPLDNKVYNWEVGFSYDGKQNPGGSVAAQTPDSSGYGIPHRVFDSRENSINRAN